ncbi:hypothetical protein BH23ACT2_BH23ACT2_25060 [soil metagenome]
MDRPDLPADAAVDPPVDESCPRCGHEVADAWLVCAWCGHQLAGAAELAPGSRLSDGRYQILSVIGRGGFGITYDVGDRRLQRRVAMKELFPESVVRHGSLVLAPPEGRSGFQAARDRFLREARVLARFTHPGIVRVYEVFEDHGTAYLVMELLEGRTLIELLQQRGRPFGDDAVLDVAGRVAAALRPVHAAGVLHRDVNPSNVMMTHHGRIVVIDFGLARDYDEERTVGMTRMVTPGYAPLEQYRGEARFGPSTDVYGLAATCYRLATGKVPVSAVERDGGARLPSPTELNPATSKALSDAILDGLELEPGHRPQDLDAFLARLGVRRLPEGPRSILLDAVPDPERADPDGRPANARALAPGVAAGAAGAGAAVGALAAYAGGGTPQPEGPEPATGATEVVPREGPEPATGATEVVPRPRPAEQPGTAPGTVPATRNADATRSPGPGPAGDPDLTRPTDPPDRTRFGGDDNATAVAGPPPGRAGGPDAPPGLGRDPDPRLRLAVGPHRPGRRKLTYPLLAVALATGSAAPVLVTAIVVVLVLPVLATVGDSVAQRLRAEHGVGGGWAEQRMSPGALAPARLVRNLVRSVVRASPVIGLGAVLIAGWYGLERLSVPRGATDLALRVTGVVVVGALIAASRHGSRGFRTGLGIDELVARVVPDGRTTERVVVIWVVTIFVVAGAIWLSPSPFPLP